MNRSSAMGRVNIKICARGVCTPAVFTTTGPILFISRRRKEGVFAAHAFELDTHSKGE